MRNYFLRRILLMIPTLFIISAVAFWLQRLAPGDPVECGTALENLSELDTRAYMKEYSRQAEIKGLTNPVFYFSVNSLAHPDTLQQLLPKVEQEISLEILQKYPNWPAVQKWRTSIKDFFSVFDEQKDSLSLTVKAGVNREKNLFQYSDDENLIRYAYDQLTQLNLPGLLGEKLHQSKNDFEILASSSQRWKLWVPTISWNGFKNQYHQWIKKIVCGDFGSSCVDGRATWTVIGPALKWTLMMTIPAIFLAFLIAIPLGVIGGLKAGSGFDRATSIMVFILNALPSFWLAILLLVFFTTPEYSKWLDWFPSIGLGRLPSSAPFWSRFWETGSHLILPIICLTYRDIAVISRQMRAGVLRILPQTYILTAKAKGLENKEVINKHILKNSIFPILTLAAGILPAAISGSVIIEFIFNIPGMGRTTLQSILAQDWPIVYAIFFLSAVVTILGIFITDLLYAWMDPRVNFKSASQESE